MSRQGLIAAKQYAVELPTFTSIAEAEEDLFSLRDAGLRELLSVPALNGKLDYSPTSLNQLEQWYFESGQPSALSSGFSVLHAIGFYFGEVFCRNADFNWVVQEFAFARGRYEIGVKRSLRSIMFTRGKQPKLSGNKRMQSLWREFNQHAS